MTRVAVIGNAGGGKSTLCRALSDARGLPYFPVDKMQWRPGWVPTPEEDFNAAHDEIVRSKTWILDGFGPWASIERRFDAADTIVFVDLPLWLHLWWATKRQFASLIWGRADGPEGCPMWRVTFRLYAMIWSIHRDLRSKLSEAIEQHGSGKTIFHICSARELADFRQAYC